VDCELLVIELVDKPMVVVLRELWLDEIVNELVEMVFELRELWLDDIS